MYIIIAHFYENEVQLLIFNNSYICISSLLDRLLCDNSIYIFITKYIVGYFIRRMCKEFNYRRYHKLYGFLLNRSIVEFPDTYKVISKLINLKEKDVIIKKLIDRASENLLNCCCI